MSQPPEQSPLVASSSSTSTTSTTLTPQPSHPHLTTPPPHPLSATLTPSLPAGSPSPLAFPPSPARPSTPPPPHPATPPAHPPPLHQSSHSLAATGQHRLTALLVGVYGLLRSYGRLSAVDGGGLLEAAVGREASDEEERQVAVVAQRQRADVEAGLAALQAIVAALVERETPKLDDGGVDEGRIQQLTARRDYLLQLVAEGNADMAELIGRLRGLHRSLGLFAHEHDMELHVVPITVPTQPVSNARR